MEQLIISQKSEDGSQNTKLINPDVYPILNDNACRNKHAIISQVCFVYGISEKELKSNTRRREIVDARAVAMYLMRKKLSVNQSTFEYIGKEFGKDHATAIHSIRKVDNLLQSDKKFKAKMEGVLW